MKLGFDHRGRKPSQGISYLLAAVVRKRGPSNDWHTVRRSPIPELLQGDPLFIKEYVLASGFQRGYCMAVMTWAVGDICVADFNNLAPNARQPVMDTLLRFEAAAFAGIPPLHRPPILWGAHTHLGRLEAHCIIPKAISNADRGFDSFNPDPPRPASRSFWLAFQRDINRQFGWAEPSVSLQSEDEPFEPFLDERSEQNHRQFNHRFFTPSTPCHPLFAQTKPMLTFSDYPTVKNEEKHDATYTFRDFSVETGGTYWKVTRRSYRFVVGEICSAINVIGAASERIIDCARYAAEEIRQFYMTIDNLMKQDTPPPQPADDWLCAEHFAADEPPLTEIEPPADTPTDWDDLDPDPDEDAPSSGFTDLTM